MLVVGVCLYIGITRLAVGRFRSGTLRFPMFHLFAEDSAQGSEIADGRALVELLTRKAFKRSQPAAAPTPIYVGAAEGCDLLILGNT